MDFGIVTAKVDEIGYIAHAENLGYSHCWVTDSQMIRSNCWAVLALAAQQKYARPMWNGYMAWLNEAPPEVRHQRLHNSHYSFVDPEEARFITPDLLKATCLTGTPEELVAQIHTLEQQGLHQLMLYPPLNRQYRVLEDFAERVMARL